MLRIWNWWITFSIGWVYRSRALFDVVREGVQITLLAKNLQRLSGRATQWGNGFPPARTTRTAVWIRPLVARFQWWPVLLLQPQFATGKTSSHDAIVLRRNIAIETLRHPSENTGQVSFPLFCIELEFVKRCSNMFMVRHDLQISLIFSDRLADWIRHFGAFYLEARDRGTETGRTLKRCSQRTLRSVRPCCMETWPQADASSGEGGTLPVLSEKREGTAKMHIIWLLNVIPILDDTRVFYIQSQLV